jgi:hypothetical protein
LANHTTTKLTGGNGVQRNCCPSAAAFGRSRYAAAKTRVHRPRSCPPIINMLQFHGMR